MRKVIGIGETVLDIIFKDGKTIGAVPGGSVFNTLVSLGRCGVQTTMVSETGKDHVGNLIADFMHDNGVGSSELLRSADVRTAISTAFLDSDNNASYTFYRDTHDSGNDLPIPDINADDIVVFGSYYAINTATHRQVRNIIDAAKAAGAIIFYDVNFRPAHSNERVKLMPNIIDNLEAADIVRGSSEDFATLYGMNEPERVYRSEISFYCRNFIYTDSCMPMTVFGEGGFTAQYQAEKISPVSTIGAGDSFNAGLIHGLIANGITRDDILRGLTAQQWDSIVPLALTFSVDCCRSIYNCVSQEFADSIKAKRQLK